MLLISWGILPSMKSPRHIRDTALALTRWVGSPISIILHSILFVAAFLLAFFGVIPFDRMLLFLTTIVSLEAIYLSIFIQMTINYTTESIEEVGQDIEEIQEDIGECISHSRRTRNGRTNSRISRKFRHGCARESGYLHKRIFAVWNR